jgi:type II secretory pathway pseudopilin PulG
MKQKKIARNAGLTIVELIVTMGIFVAMSSLILVNHSRYNRGFSLTSLAYDMALSIREAQVRAVGTQQFSDSDGVGRLEIGYGLHFDVTDGTSYLFFADCNSPTDPSVCNGNDADGQYKPADDDVIEIFTLAQGNTISGVCVTPGACRAVGPMLNPLRFIDIVFRRPDPDAKITSFPTSVDRDETQIIISSPQGQTRTILVTKTGQISVQ